MSSALAAVEITEIVGRVLGPAARWQFLPARDKTIISIPGRSIEIEGHSMDSDSIVSACYRLLGNRANKALVPESATEYEAATNGRRLL